jgi:hypothetical protein
VSSNDSSSVHLVRVVQCRCRLTETGGTPREVVHLPERVQREEERREGDGEDVDCWQGIYVNKYSARHRQPSLTEHPGDHIPAHAEDEDERLQAVNCREHDD